MTCQSVIGAIHELLADWHYECKRSGSVLRYLARQAFTGT